MKSLIWLLIIFFVVEQQALVERKLVPLTSDNTVLAKILQSVDAASSHDHLFDVTLKLLKSLCVCMRETLREKEESILFNDGTNLLQSEDHVHSKDVLSLYKKIYNNTCFNLREELVGKLNSTRNTFIGDDDDDAFLQQTNCGKRIANEIENAINGPRQYFKLEIKSKLQHILYKILIDTKDFHKYRIRRRSLFGKAKPSVKSSLSHSVIVILTLNPKLSSNKTVHDSENIEENELNETLYSKSIVDIDIIDAKYDVKNLESEEVAISNIALDCHLQSVYTFLIECEKRNMTKVFRLLRKKGTIKIYIDVTTLRNHSDYSAICCDNGQTIASCKKNFIREFFESEMSREDENNVAHPIITGEETTYKDTLSKIKKWVKLYEQEFKSDNVTKVRNRIIEGLNNCNTIECLTKMPSATDMVPYIQNVPINVNKKQKIIDNLDLKRVINSVSPKLLTTPSINLSDFYKKDDSLNISHNNAFISNNKSTYNSYFTTTPVVTKSIDSIGITQNTNTDYNKIITLVKETTEYNTTTPKAMTMTANDKETTNPLVTKPDNFQQEFSKKDLKTTKERSIISTDVQFLTTSPVDNDLRRWKMNYTTKQYNFITRDIVPNFTTIKPRRTSRVSLNSEDNTKQTYTEFSRDTSYHKTSDYKNIAMTVHINNNLKEIFETDERDSQQISENVSIQPFYYDSQNVNSQMSPSTYNKMNNWMQFKTTNIPGKQTIIRATQSSLENKKKTEKEFFSIGPRTYRLMSHFPPITTRNYEPYFNVTTKDIHDFKSDNQNIIMGKTTRPNEDRLTDNISSQKLKFNNVDTRTSSDGSITRNYVVTYEIKPQVHHTTTLWRHISALPTKKLYSNAVTPVNNTDSIFTINNESLISTVSYNQLSTQLESLNETLQWTTESSLSMDTMPTAKYSITNEELDVLPKTTSIQNAIYTTRVNYDDISSSGTKKSSSYTSSNIETLITTARSNLPLTIRTLPMYGTETLRASKKFFDTKAFTTIAPKLYTFNKLENENLNMATKYDDIRKSMKTNFTTKKYSITKNTSIQNAMNTTRIEQDVTSSTKESQKTTAKHILPFMQNRVPEENLLRAANSIFSMQASTASAPSIMFTSTERQNNLLNITNDYQYTQAYRETYMPTKEIQKTPYKRFLPIMQNTVTVKVKDLLKTDTNVASSEISTTLEPNIIYSSSRIRNKLQNVTKEYNSTSETIPITNNKLEGLSKTTLRKSAIFKTLINKDDNFKSGTKQTLSHVFSANEKLKTTVESYLPFTLKTSTEALLQTSNNGHNTKALITLSPNIMYSNSERENEPLNTAKHKNASRTTDNNLIRSRKKNVLHTSGLIGPQMTEKKYLQSRFDVPNTIRYPEMIYSTGLLPMAENLVQPSTSLTRNINPGRIKLFNTLDTIQPSNIIMLKQDEYMWQNNNSKMESVDTLEKLHNQIMKSPKLPDLRRDSRKGGKNRLSKNKSKTYRKYVKKPRKIALNNQAPNMYMHGDTNIVIIHSDVQTSQEQKIDSITKTPTKSYQNDKSKSTLTIWDQNKNTHISSNPLVEKKTRHVNNSLNLNQESIRFDKSATSIGTTSIFPYTLQKTTNVQTVSLSDVVVEQQEELTSVIKENPELRTTLTLSNVINPATEKYFTIRNVESAYKNDTKTHVNLSDFNYFESNKKYENKDVRQVTTKAITSSMKPRTNWTTQEDRSLITSTSNFAFSYKAQNNTNTSRFHLPSEVPEIPINLVMKNTSHTTNIFEPMIESTKVIKKELINAVHTRDNETNGTQKININQNGRSKNTQRLDNSVPTNTTISDNIKVHITKKENMSSQANPNNTKSILFEQGNFTTSKLDLNIVQTNKLSPQFTSASNLSYNLEMIIKNSSKITTTRSQEQELGVSPINNFIAEVTPKIDAMLFTTENPHINELEISLSSNKQNRTYTKITGKFNKSYLRNFSTRTIAYTESNSVTEQYKRQLMSTENGAQKLQHSSYKSTKYAITSPKIKDAIIGMQNKLSDNIFEKNIIYGQRQTGNTKHKDSIKRSAEEHEIIGKDMFFTKRVPEFNELAENFENIDPSFFSQNSISDLFQTTEKKTTSNPQNIGSSKHERKNVAQTDNSNPENISKITPTLITVDASGEPNNESDNTKITRVYVSDTENMNKPSIENRRQFLFDRLTAPLLKYSELPKIPSKIKTTDNHINILGESYLRGNDNIIINTNNGSNYTIENNAAYKPLLRSITKTSNKSTNDIKKLQQNKSLVLLRPFWETLLPESTTKKLVFPDMIPKHPPANLSETMEVENKISYDPNNSQADLLDSILILKRISNNPSIPMDILPGLVQIPDTTTVYPEHLQANIKHTTDMNMSTITSDYIKNQQPNIQDSKVMLEKMPTQSKNNTSITLDLKVETLIINVGDLMGLVHKKNQTSELVSVQNASKNTFIQEFLEGIRRSNLNITNIPELKEKNKGNTLLTNYIDTNKSIAEDQIQSSNFKTTNVVQRSLKNETVTESYQILKSLGNTTAILPGKKAKVSSLQNAGNYENKKNTINHHTEFFSTSNDLLSEEVGINTTNKMNMSSISTPEPNTLQNSQIQSNYKSYLNNTNAISAIKKNLSKNIRTTNKNDILYLFKTTKQEHAAVNDTSTRIKATAVRKNNRTRYSGMAPVNVSKEDSTNNLKSIQNFNMSTNKDNFYTTGPISVTISSSENETKHLYHTQLEKAAVSNKITKKFRTTEKIIRADTKYFKKLKSLDLHRDGIKNQNNLNSDVILPFNKSTDSNILTTIKHHPHESNGMMPSNSLYKDNVITNDLGITTTETKADIDYINYVLRDKNETQLYAYLLNQTYSNTTTATYFRNNMDQTIFDTTTRNNIQQLSSTENSRRFLKTIAHNMPMVTESMKSFQNIKNEINMEIPSGILAEGIFSLVKEVEPYTTTKISAIQNFTTINHTVNTKLAQDNSVKENPVEAPQFNNLSNYFNGNHRNENNLTENNCEITHKTDTNVQELLSRNLIQKYIRQNDSETNIEKNHKELSTSNKSYQENENSKNNENNVSNAKTLIGYETEGKTLNNDSKLMTQTINNKRKGITAFTKEYQHVSETSQEVHFTTGLSINATTNFTEPNTTSEPSGSTFSRTKKYNNEFTKNSMNTPSNNVYDYSITEHNSRKKYSDPLHNIEMNVKNTASTKDRIVLNNIVKTGMESDDDSGIERISTMSQKNDKRSNNISSSNIETLSIINDTISFQKVPPTVDILSNSGTNLSEPYITSLTPVIQTISTKSEKHDRSSKINNYITISDGYTEALNAKPLYAYDNIDQHKTKIYQVSTSTEKSKKVLGTIAQITDTENKMDEIIKELSTFTSYENGNIVDQSINNEKRMSNDTIKTFITLADTFIKNIDFQTADTQLTEHSNATSVIDNTYSNHMTAPPNLSYYVYETSQKFPSTVGSLLQQEMSSETSHSPTFSMKSGTHETSEFYYRNTNYNDYTQAPNALLNNSNAAENEPGHGNVELTHRTEIYGQKEAFIQASKPPKTVADVSLGTDSGSTFENLYITILNTSGENVLNKNIRSSNTEIEPLIVTSETKTMYENTGTLLIPETKSESIIEDTYKHQITTPANKYNDFRMVHEYTFQGVSSKKPFTDIKELINLIYLNQTNTDETTSTLKYRIYNDNVKAGQYNKPFIEKYSFDYPTDSIINGKHSTKSIDQTSPKTPSTRRAVDNYKGNSDLKDFNSTTMINNVYTNQITTSTNDEHKINQTYESVQSITTNHPLLAKDYSKKYTKDKNIQRSGNSNNTNKDQYTESVNYESPYIIDNKTTKKYSRKIYAKPTQTNRIKTVQLFLNTSEEVDWHLKPGDLPATDTDNEAEFEKILKDLSTIFSDENRKTYKQGENKTFNDIMKTPLNTEKYFVNNLSLKTTGMYFIKENSSTSKIEDFSVNNITEAKFTGTSQASLQRQISLQGKQQYEIDADVVFTSPINVQEPVVKESKVLSSSTHTLMYDDSVLTTVQHQYKDLRNLNQFENKEYFQSSTVTTYYTTPMPTVRTTRKYRKIIYNTYKPTTEEEFDNLFDEDIRSKFKPIIPKSQPLKPKAQNTCNMLRNLSHDLFRSALEIKKLLKSNNCSQGLTTSDIKDEVRDMHPNVMVKNIWKQPSKRNNFVDAFAKTNLYPVNEIRSNRLKLERQIPIRKELMTMNTQDFFAKRMVTARNMERVVKMYPKPVMVRRPPSSLPRHLILRPKFETIDKPIVQEHFRPKPLFIKRENEFYRDGLKYQRHPLGLTWKEKVGVIQNAINTHTLDQALERPGLLKQSSETRPKYLRDRVDSIPSYLYKADFVRPSKRPPNPGNFFYDSMEGSEELNVSPVSRRKETRYVEPKTTTKRPKRKGRTLFFLSPTVSYKNYF